MGGKFNRGLLAGVGALMVLIAVNAAVSHRNTQRLTEDARWIAHSQEVQGQVAEVRRTLVEAESAYRSFLLTRDQAFLTPYEEAVATLPKRLAALRELTQADAAERDWSDRLAALATARMVHMQEGLDLLLQGDGSGKNERVREGTRRMDAVRELIDAMTAAEDRMLRDRQERTSSAYAMAVAINLTVSAIGFVLVVALAWLLNRSVVARQRAAAAVHQQRELLRTTLASIGDAVIATDTQGRVTFINAIAQQLTGWTAAEAIGKRVEEVFPIFDEQSGLAAETPVQQVLREGTLSGMTNHTVLVSRDGSRRPIEESGSPIRDEQGQMFGVVLVFRDVTERRRTEAAVRESEGRFRQMAANLSEADRRKDEFLATLAHELRNPLAPIHNGLHLLKLSGDDRQILEQTRTMMERQLSQMVRLVDDLLDVSRITRNKLELRKERVELAAVITSAVETSRPLITAAEHDLSIHVPSTPIYVDADPTRLAQVFSNLLNNAAKYTERGGRIELTAECPDGEEVVVSVKDTGAGIPPEMLARVFEAFTQVDRTLERSQGGLGIGLTLVQRLVEMHGGKVEARSEGDGCGSEFLVRLPVATAPTTQGPDDSSDSVPRDGARRRILVVDDNQDAAKALGMLLEMMGNEVRVVHDGEAAVEAAPRFGPDVILLDIGLPKMNGYDACRAIRQQARNDPPVIVACTGWGQPEDRRRSQEAGFDFHLVKPVAPAALEQVLAEQPLTATAPS